ncbi:MAG: hypothetical protein ACRD2L_00895, partial [Terriglobia bacterium]
ALGRSNQFTEPLSRDEFGAIHSSAMAMQTAAMATGDPDLAYAGALVARLANAGRIAVNNARTMDALFKAFPALRIIIANSNYLDYVIGTDLKALEFSLVHEAMHFRFYYMANGGFRDLTGNECLMDSRARMATRTDYRAYNCPGWP